MTSTLITSYLGEGLLASRPSAPAIDASACALWWATDQAVGSQLSVYAAGAWTTLSSGGPGAEVAAFLAVPANPGFDPASIGTSVTLSNSNKTATPASSSPYNYAYGTTARYTGKRYYEFSPGSTSFESIGFTGTAGRTLDNGQGSPNSFGTRVQGQIGWASDGSVKTCGVGENSPATLSTVATWTSGNRLSFALDIDNLLLWLRVGAGNWNNNASADPAAGTLGISAKWLLSGAASWLIWPGCNMGNTSASSMYLKTADFTQTVPAGFSSWSGL